jgi:hypothetical protein
VAKEMEIKEHIQEILWAKKKRNNSVFIEKERKGRFK